jgi:hypothetical protein
VKPFRRLPLLTCLLALAACSPSPSDPQASPAGAAGAGDSVAPASAEAEAVAVAVPPLPELGEFRIAQLLLGSALDADGLVRSDMQEFAPTDTIHASVLSVGAHPGLRLAATWIGPDGNTIARTEQPIAPEGPIATNFHIANPDGWPPGEYTLRLALDGHPIPGRTFEVKP